MTRLEDITARHEVAERDRDRTALGGRAAHSDRAWLLDLVNDAAELLTMSGVEVFSLGSGIAWRRRADAWLARLEETA